MSGMQWSRFSVLPDIPSTARDKESQSPKQNFLLHALHFAAGLGPGFDMLGVEFCMLPGYEPQGGARID